MSVTPSPLPPELALVAGDAEPVTQEQIDATMELASLLGVTPGEVADAETLRGSQTARGSTGRWRIEDDSAAEWAYRVLAGLDADAQTVEDQAAAWMQRIVDWRDAQLATMRYDSRRAFFEFHLIDYAMRLREVDPKRKTFKYPSGTTKTTSYASKAAVADEHAVIAWARSLPDEEIEKVLTVTTKVSLTGLREVVVLVDVADEVVLSCGETVQTKDGQLIRAGGDWAPGTYGTVWVGDGVVCPECSHEVLVGDVTASHLVVQHPSLGDVPGTAVESGGLNVRVVPDHG